MNTTETSEYIVNWLKEYCQKAGSKGFVIGISGGIDSAVTSTLCAKTGLPTLCIEMPIHQGESQINRAENHISFLKNNYPNISSEAIDLSDNFDSFVNLLPDAETAKSEELALINTRARLRMTTLYYFATIRNSLVAGTGNKIEDFGIGFFTKYGDGGVDLSPIADLTKTEVFAIGKEIGVIKDILIAPPTDGLWNDDRTDEDQIGASYPELEWAMDFKGDKNKLSNRQQEVLAIYTRMNRSNQHKMVPIPVCEIPR